MKTTIALEFIAENLHSYKRSANTRHEGTERYEKYLGKDQSRPWVARLTGYQDGKLIREFMRSQIDYSRTNSTGSRGVYLYFYLDDGIYEVNERVTWKRSRRYFIRAINGVASEISQEDARQCLNSF